MKKRYKILAGILILWIMMFCVDYVRAKNNKKPIFAIRVATYMDHGSCIAFGIGYRVNCYVYEPISPIMPQYMTKVEIGFYNMEFDSDKNAPPGYNYIRGHEKEIHERLKNFDSPYDFELKDQYGNTQTLKQYYNKIVVLTFWASWCEPCREELPSIEELYKEYGENKGEVVFLGMARTANANANLQDTSKEEIAAFIQQNQYTFPVAFDETGDMIKTYEIKKYPTVVVMNKDRKIGGMVENKQSKEEIKAKIEEVRNQKQSCKKEVLSIKYLLFFVKPLLKLRKIVYNIV